jgi:hypothetical protein
MNYGGVDVHLHHYQGRHWVEVGGQLEAPAASREETFPGTQHIGGWLGPRKRAKRIIKKKKRKKNDKEQNGFTQPGIEPKFFAPTRTRQLCRLLHAKLVTNKQMKPKQGC